MESKFVKNRKIGEILVRKNFLREEIIKHSLEVSLKTNKKIGEVLIENRLITNDELLCALAIQHGCIFYQQYLDKEYPTKDALDLVTYKTALKFKAMPLKCDDNSLLLAISNPELIPEIDLTKRNYTIVPVVSYDTEIVKAIRRCYNSNAIAAHGIADR